MSKKARVILWIGLTFISWLYAAWIYSGIPWHTEDVSVEIAVIFHLVVSIPFCLYLLLWGAHKIWCFLFKTSSKANVVLNRTEKLWLFIALGIIVSFLNTVPYKNIPNSFIEYTSRFSMNAILVFILLYLICKLLGFVVQATKK